jgi:hypothetical protein
MHVRLVAAVCLSSAVAVAADKSLFDLEKDLARFFEAQAAVIETEPNGNDTPADTARKKAERAEVFRKYGFRDEKHWKEQNHIGMTFAFSKKAERIYGGEAAVSDMRRAAGEGKTLKQYREDRLKMNEAAAEARERFKLIGDEGAFDQALLAPIDGVSLEKYAAAANAAIFYGDDYAPVAKETGISEQRFEKLGEQWTERMRTDPTRLLMSKYGGHLFLASRGRFAAAGKELGKAYLAGKDTPLAGPEPIPFEKWVEVTEYYAAKGGQVKTPADTTRLLQPYGLDFYEWMIVSNWWGRKRTESIEGNDSAFLARWGALREKYRLKFASGG